MKTILIIILTSINLVSLGQNIDSLGNDYYGSIIGDNYNPQNQLDSNGLKQGHWTHYSMLTVNNCGRIPELEFETRQVPETIFRAQSEGHYLNDKKVGEWVFYDDGSNYNVTNVRTDYYDDHGFLIKSIKTISKVGVVINVFNDSSEVKVSITTRNYMFNINCENQICECLLDNKKLYDFELKNLELEMDKLDAGIYDRHIKQNIKIKYN